MRQTGAGGGRATALWAAPTLVTVAAQAAGAASVGGVVTRVGRWRSAHRVGRRAGAVVARKVRGRRRRQFRRRAFAVARPETAVPESLIGAPGRIEPTVCEPPWCGGGDLFLLTGAALAAPLFALR